MRECKYTEFFKYIASTLAIAFIFLGAGCSSSADSLLENSLEIMNSDVSSYKFNGIAIMNMGGLQGSGKIKYAGSFKAPGQLYMKTDLGTMDQTQNMELYVNNSGKVFTRVSGTEWQPYLAPPNLSNFQQPGQSQNAAQILKNLAAIAGPCEIAGSKKINGIETSVVQTSADPDKLKALISKQLTSNSHASEEQIETIKQLIKGMTIVQEYTLYVNPDTNFIHRVDLRQKTGLKMGEQEIKIVADMTFNYYDFNKPVDMPTIEGAGEEQ
ncbi:DUF6612 family protein [Thermincola ferriacetica]